MKALPIIERQGKKYFVDARLGEMRNIEDPSDAKPYVPIEYLPFHGKKKKYIGVKGKKGWHLESARHSLARRGVKTGRKTKNPTIKKKIQKLFISRNKLDKMIEENRGQVGNPSISDEDRNEIVDYVADAVNDIGLNTYYENGIGAYGSPSEIKEIKETISNAIIEKVHDVEWEKKHGERE